MKPIVQNEPNSESSQLRLSESTEIDHKVLRLEVTESQLDGRHINTIREKALKRTKSAAITMSNYYNKKKGVNIWQYSVGQRVTLSVRKADRTATDLPRIPCIVSEVHGEKVKSYSLANSYGALKGRYPGGDLQPYSGIVESGSLSAVLSYREVAREFNSENRFLKSNCKCKCGRKNNRCS